MFIGILLVIVGLVFLLKNVGLIAESVWGILWPSVVIALGLYSILKMHRCRMFWGKVWKKLD